MEIRTIQTLTGGGRGAGSTSRVLKLLFLCEPGPTVYQASLAGGYSSASTGQEGPNTLVGQKASFFDSSGAGHGELTFEPLLNTALWKVRGGDRKRGTVPDENLILYCNSSQQSCTKILRHRLCLSRSSSGRERLHKQRRNCLEARKVGCPSFQLLPSLYVHPTSGRKLQFLACILLPSVSAARSRPHKQWICFSISAGTGFIAQSTGDDGLDCFQVAFGDEYVAVAFQPFPVGRRMSQVI